MITYMQITVADLGEGPGGPLPPPPLILVKNEEMTEGKMAGRASKSRPGPLLSSSSGSATELGEIKIRRRTKAK